jgi:hypothetical protein
MRLPNRVVWAWDIVEDRPCRTVAGLVAKAVYPVGSVPYLDLADARTFVTGIAALDGPAHEAGVAIIAGASSVPALSGAVARRLADGLDAIRAVEISISASNRATSGKSVAAAILSYVGRPIRLWRGRRWTWGRGWQGLRRETFVVEGTPALKGRWLALAEVPDLDLMPDMLPGRPAARLSPFAPAPTSPCRRSLCGCSHGRCAGWAWRRWLGWPSSCRRCKG